MNVYQQYHHAAQARKLFTEYANLARMVDDLDIRFWKKYVTRDFVREDSIDCVIDEDALRKEYQSCVTDLIALRRKVEKALDSINDDLIRALIRDRYIRGMDEEAIAEKWQMEEAVVGMLIQKGLMEAAL